ncbi:hypothetical protein [Stenotrophomonas indicatrix]|uniref:hypothetical protein n=1 Tax=Stenotrophomonas indicatrix TaxID=2045451 RepID=UPI002897C2EE|nr:hypothetical protein [Stenotrophomonas indicatrix]
MSNESLFALLLSLPIGVVSGLYSSLIVTKYARFSELRREALRIIRSINFVGDNEGAQIIEPDNLDALALIASDLIGLGHDAAGKEANRIYDVILSSNAAALAGAISAKRYLHLHASWQQQVRCLGPNKRIYLPWGWP